MSAVADATEKVLNWEITSIEPFNSARKWSAVEFSGHGTFFFGAPDILLESATHDAQQKAQSEAERGRRVLALCKIDTPLNEGFQGAVDPVCLILLDDTVGGCSRDSKIFADQGVDSK